MSNYKYKFTLFTPCYNSARCFDRIIETVEKQTFRDFEWIVINDASTDNTSELLKDYIKTVSFPVKFYDLTKNQMLAANYNLAVENAEGEIFVVLGHDDIYLPHMLETYNTLYEKYNDETIGAIVGRCQTQYGKITPKPFEKDISTYWEYGVDKDGNYSGEAPCAYKTDVLKKYIPFPPEDLLNPTIGKLMGIDGYRFITTNEIVRKYFVFEKEGSSLTSNFKKYASWAWKNELLNINKCSNFYHSSNKVICKRVFSYACWSVIYKRGFVKSFCALEKYKVLFVIFYPFALIKEVLASNKFLYAIYKARKMKKIQNGNA